MNRNFALSRQNRGRSVIGRSVSAHDKTNEIIVSKKMNLKKHQYFKVTYFGI